MTRSLFVLFVLVFAIGCDPSDPRPNKDDCSANPCLNGGTCTDGVESYVCTCAKGYAGLNCGIKQDDCSPNPCRNGGTCAAGANGATCTCPAGFEGATCQTNIDECSPNPCLNGGSCTDGVNSFTCACTGGFSGPTCAEMGVARRRPRRPSLRR